MKQFSRCVAFLFLILCLCGFESEGQNNLRKNIDSYLKQFTVYKSSNTHSYTEDSVISDVLSLLAWDMKSINADSALFFGHKALSIAEEVNYERGIATAYNQIGAIYRQKGEYFKALDCYGKSIEIYKAFEKSNPAYFNSTLRTYLSRGISNLGVLYLALNQPDKAIDMFLQALKIDEMMGYKKGMASKIGNIGGLFYGQKKYEKANEYFLKAIPIFKEVNDKTGLAQAYQNAGETYRQLGNYPKAKEHYLMAIEITTAQGNKQLLSENYNNLGLVYDIEKNYKEAEDLYLKSLSLKTETDDKAGISIVLGNIGSMYIDRNLLSEAEKYFLQATTISDSLKNMSTQIDQHTNLCSLYIKKGEYRKALDEYQQVTSLKDSLYDEEKTEEITRKEMNYEFDKKEALAKAEYENQIAIEAANKKIAIAEADKKRTLAETEKRIAVAEAENKRIAAEAERQKTITETDKKIAIIAADKKRTVAEADKKIAISNAETQQQKIIRNSIAAGAGILILSSIFSFFFYKRKRDAVQKQKETSLNLQVSSTEMKALRSQMNPHFIFNALQSIQTFLLSNKSEDANLYLLKFSKLMRAVLENSQHSEVPLKNDIQALELYMQLESIRLKHPFTYRFHIDESVDVENDTIPPLILQPFVENAIWHGLQYKPGPGYINIYLSKKDNALHAIVEDNGIGRNNSKEVVQPVLLKKESLGMKLTEERLKVLNEVKKTNAHFTITDLFTKNNEPGGTKVELLLPLVA